MNQWNKIKITVIKKFVAEDLVRDYVAEDRKNSGFGVCNVVGDGQEFILEKPNMPEGFCSWAWADINRDIIAIMGGGSMPWINKEGVAIASCTDGLRPVVFKIERI